MANGHVHSLQPLSGEASKYLLKRVPEALNHLLKNSKSNGFPSLEILKQIMAFGYAEQKGGKMTLVLGAMDDSRKPCNFRIDLETLSSEKKMAEASLLDCEKPVAWIWIAPSDIVDAGRLHALASDVVFQSLASGFPHNRDSANYSGAGIPVKNEFSGECANFNMVLYQFYD